MLQHFNSMLAYHPGLAGGEAGIALWTAVAIAYVPAPGCQKLQPMISLMHTVTVGHLRAGLDFIFMLELQLHSPSRSKALEVPAKLRQAFGLGTACQYP